MGEEELLIHELVGAGGFAQVFRASWRPKAGGGSVRTVAVKQLRDLPHQPAPLRAFCSEISLMQGFAHPNVLGLLGVCAGADGSLRMARHATARRRTPRAAAAAAPPPPPPPSPSPPPTHPHPPPPPPTPTPTCPPQPRCASR